MTEMWTKRALPPEGPREDIIEGTGLRWSSGTIDDLYGNEQIVHQVIITGYPINRPGKCEIPLLVSEAFLDMLKVSIAEHDKKHAEWLLSRYANQ